MNHKAHQGHQERQQELLFLFFPSCSLWALWFTSSSVSAARQLLRQRLHYPNRRTRRLPNLPTGTDLMRHSHRLPAVDSCVQWRNQHRAACLALPFRPRIPMPTSHAISESHSPPAHRKRHSMTWGGRDRCKFCNPLLDLLIATVAGLKTVSTPRRNAAAPCQSGRGAACR